MGNLSLFFCLYGSNWLDPAHCNSSRSRAMGFLTTLPSIWRALQCLRRYRDTKNLFPHVVNFGKYSCSILYYMTLSLYRIKRVESLHALFISFALINAIYTSVWDVAMDWSLGNPFSKHPYLRDFLGFRRRWIYYAAMIIDPILRFNWIFYAIFIHDLQHSAILSFLVSLSEVFRRGIWSIFRVENEHCTNVGRFRAFRDVPLPYDLPSESSTDENQPGEHPSPQPEVQPLPIVHLAPSHPSTSVDVEHTAAEATPSTVRRRRSSHRPETPTIPSGTLARVGTMLANAHAEDFERRRRPAVVGKSHEELARHSMHENAGLGRDSSTEEEESDRSETEGAGDGESDLSLRLSSGSGCDDEDDDRVAKK
ncbi:Xenotropic and polytropic retrovirus receptor 1 [Ophidiomyces ophidiicola]|nr:Xenotropic and polytropic retrovirus receptor 1 [Ophidiomyces ophidiicola]KAI1982734.1 Xenotropic and polytropic retrovirus receptor 1 [Ophidiomyces ophidiicola]KAI1996121.1 Xenotropic and polytropic retrovirus receptor 1 [Ophidiomyces ophidiicola]KAI2000723.1 Xenotropic and polytropic retrovirus receptor 1 [Ophidiomyces ophidiicola]